MEKLKELKVRVDPEVHKRLKLCSVDEELTMAETLEKLLDLYDREKKKQPPQSSSSLGLESLCENKSQQTLSDLPEDPRALLGFSIQKGIEVTQEAIEKTEKARNIQTANRELMAAIEQDSEVLFARVRVEEALLGRKLTGHEIIDRTSQLAEQKQIEK